VVLGGWVLFWLGLWFCCGVFGVFFFFFVICVGGGFGGVGGGFFFFCFGGVDLFLFCFFDFLAFLVGCFGGWWVWRVQRAPPPSAT